MSFPTFYLTCKAEILFGTWALVWDWANLHNLLGDTYSHLGFLKLSIFGLWFWFVLMFIDRKDNKGLKINLSGERKSPAGVNKKAHVLVGKGSLGHSKWSQLELPLNPGPILRFPVGCHCFPYMDVPSNAKWFHIWKHRITQSRHSFTWPPEWKSYRVVSRHCFVLCSVCVPCMGICQPLFPTEPISQGLGWSWFNLPSHTDQKFIWIFGTWKHHFLLLL